MNKRLSGDSTKVPTVGVCYGIQVLFTNAAADQQTAVSSACCQQCGQIKVFFVYDHAIYRTNIFARQLQPSYATLDTQQGRRHIRHAYKGIANNIRQHACCGYGNIHTSTLHVLSNHLNAISADQGSKGCVRHACALSVSSVAKGLFHAVYVWGR